MAESAAQHQDADQDGDGRTLLDGVNLPAAADLRAAFGLVGEAQTQRAAAEAQEAQALQLVQDTLVTLALQVGDDQKLRADVLQELYWLAPSLRVAWLADAFGLGTKEVSKVAGKASLPITCSQCGEDFRIIVTSRGDLQQQESNHQGRRGAPPVCPACQEDVNRQLSEYAARERAAIEERLWQLRTMPYREYLRTPEWQERRGQQLRRAGYRCQVCNASRVQLNVHHRTYERRGIESFKDLVVLCANCHELFHRQGKLARED